MFSDEILLLIVISNHGRAIGQLKDVIFSSGLVHSSSGTRLYAGLSDVEAHCIAIPDPF